MISATFAEIGNQTGSAWFLLEICATIPAAVAGFHQKIVETQPSLGSATTMIIWLFVAG